jgi:LEA14-like dessication related protein
MKRLFTIFLVSTIFCLWFSSCESLRAVLQEPRVSLRTVDLGGISFNGVDMIARLNVENPNSFDIPFPEIDWHVFINDNSFVSGTLTNDTRLRSRRTVTVDVPFSVSYSGLFNSIASLWGASEAGYHIALGIRFPLPIISGKTYNVDFSGVIPLLQVPRIQAGSFSTGRIDFTGVEQNWIFTVENPNAFPIPLPDLNWNYAVNGVALVRGGVVGAGQIDALSETPVNIRVGVQYADILAVLGTLANSSQVSSLMKLDSNFNLPGMEGLTGFASSLEMPSILPIFHKPEISFQGISIKNMALQRFEFVVSWEIDNKNDFPLDLSNFDYNLLVNNTQWAQGILSNPPRINAKSKTVIPLELSINSVALITQIIDIVNRGSPVNFRSQGNFNVQGGGLERTGMPFDLSGVTRLLRL